MDKVKVTLWPDAQVVEVEKGAKLMTALKQEGFHINSSCGGCASCSDCVVIVKSGEDNLSAQKFEELKLLGNVFHITKERLSCQAEVLGDITVDISKHADKSVHKAYQEKKSGTVRTKKKEQVLEEQKEREEKRQERFEKKQSEAGQRGGFKRPKTFKVPKGE
jgi:ferredoxin